jgi:predicted nucleotidyltransferase
MIQNILPNSEARLRILRTVYRNPKINFSDLVRKSKTSPNIVLKYVNELVKGGVLKETRLGGKKKTHIRLLEPNFSGIGIDIFSFVEMEEKNSFLKKYKELKPITMQIEELLSSSSAKFCLIYGSFARYAADNESDLDMWLVGKVNGHVRNRLNEIFSTVKVQYEITIEKEAEFAKRINDPIHQNMINDHIIIYGEKNFLKMLSALLPKML